MLGSLESYQLEFILIDSFERFHYYNFNTSLVSFHPFSLSKSSQRKRHLISDRKRFISFSDRFKKSYQLAISNVWLGPCDTESSASKKRRKESLQEVQFRNYNWKHRIRCWKSYNCYFLITIKYTVNLQKFKI